ncbi:hypothetical protein, partial [Bordetella pertussis]|uniref:hypothetical protein n=1 Tax=Bordetella pertussis TaxID=520 RepID=UPI0021CB2F81
MLVDRRAIAGGKLLGQEDVLDRDGYAGQQPARGVRIQAARLRAGGVDVELAPGAGMSWKGFLAGGKGERAQRQQRRDARPVRR